MADVTISSLPLGTPSGSGLIPYSQGGSTLSTSPSGIVAASPGSIINVTTGDDTTEYGPFELGPTSPYGEQGPIDTTLFTINLKNPNNRLIVDTILYGFGASKPSLEPIDRNFYAPGFCLQLKRVINNVNTDINFLGKCSYTVMEPRDSSRNLYHVSTVSSRLSILPNASSITFRAQIGSPSITTSQLTQVSFQWTAFEVVV